MHPQPLSGVTQRDRRNRFFFALILTKMLMEVNRDFIFACKDGNPAIIILLIFSIKGVI